MTVDLLYNTPLWVASQAIRTCWASQDNSDTCNTNDNIGEADKALIDRVSNKFKHESTVEHINYSFKVLNVSTKTLLALSCHRVGISLSVESTRYTTKKNSSTLSFTKTSNKSINSKLDRILSIVEEAISEGLANDDIAMLLPQAYNYSFILTMNMRSLKHFLELRLDKSAHWDIQELAKHLYKAIPEQHKYLYGNIVKDNI